MAADDLLARFVGLIPVEDLPVEYQRRLVGELNVRIKTCVYKNVFRRFKKRNGCFQELPMRFRNTWNPVFFGLSSIRNQCFDPAVTSPKIGFQWIFARFK